MKDKLFLVSASAAMMRDSASKELLTLKPASGVLPSGRPNNLAS